jgi:hypothetical protein
VINPLAVVNSAPFNPSQAYHSQLIVREFLAAGLPVAVSLAAVANAYAESRLDPKAVGDSGRSVGLFQINIVNGPFDFDRTDPVGNIRWTIDETRRRGGSVVALAHQGATVAVLTDRFASDVERCDWSVCGDRESVARQLFGPLADVDTSSWSYAQPVLTTFAWFSTIPWWAWTTLGVGTTGALLLLLRRR